MSKSKEQWIQHGKKFGYIYLFYNGNVLNLARFMKKHPGGEQAIKNYGFKDITNTFFYVFPHPSNSQKVLLSYKIGNYDQQIVQALKSAKSLRKIQGKQQKQNHSIFKKKVEFEDHEKKNLFKNSQCEISQQLINDQKPLFQIPQLNVIKRLSDLNAVDGNISKQQIQ